MIEFIKKTLKSNGIGRAIYPSLNKLYRLYSVPARQRILKKVGADVLKEIVEINGRNNLGILPIYGTLLGFVRDGGFMKHDDDIDLAVMPGKSPKDILNVFVVRHGWEFLHGLSYHGKCTEFTLKHKTGLTVDFFFMQDSGEDLLSSVYFWKEGEPYTDIRQNNLKWVRHPYVNALRKFNLYGLDIDIPDNSEDWLYYEFGSGWKVPDPSYTDAAGQPGKVVVDDYGFTTTYDEIMQENIPQ